MTNHTENIKLQHFCPVSFMMPFCLSHNRFILSSVNHTISTAAVMMGRGFGLRKWSLIIIYN